MFLQVSVCPRGEYLGRYPRQVHPPTGTHPRQVQPPWAGTPPLGRYTPRPQCMLGYGQQPQTGTTPLSRYTPPGQVHPPATVHAGIRSTSGRYASHWNAFLFSGEDVRLPQKRSQNRILFNPDSFSTESIEFIESFWENILEFRVERAHFYSCNSSLQAKWADSEVVRTLYTILKRLPPGRNVVDKETCIIKAYVVSWKFIRLKLVRVNSHLMTCDFSVLMCGNDWWHRYWTRSLGLIYTNLITFKACVRLQRNIAIVKCKDTLHFNILPNSKGLFTFNVKYSAY